MQTVDKESKGINTACDRFETFGSQIQAQKGREIQICHKIRILNDEGCLRDSERKTSKQHLVANSQITNQENRNWNSEQITKRNENFGGNEQNKKSHVRSKSSITAADEKISIDEPKHINISQKVERSTQIQVLDESDSNKTSSNNQNSFKPIDLSAIMNQLQQQNQQKEENLFNGKSNKKHQDNVISKESFLKPKDGLLKENVNKLNQNNGGLIKVETVSVKQGLPISKFPKEKQMKPAKDIEQSIMNKSTMEVNPFQQNRDVRQVRKSRSPNFRLLEQKSQHMQRSTSRKRTPLRKPEFNRQVLDCVNEIVNEHISQKLQKSTAKLY